MPPFPEIKLPFNSASLWASTYDDLAALYNSPYTGAVTTRTACLVDNGFAYDNRTRQHAFFSNTSQKSLTKLSSGQGTTIYSEPYLEHDLREISTLNTLGYSHYPLKYYIESVRKIQSESRGPHKPVIFSVAGSSSSILACYSLLAKNYDPTSSPCQKWCMEINLSCPNIAGASPPAFSRIELARLLDELSNGIRSLILQAKRELEIKCVTDEEIQRRLDCWNMPIGLKLPPYTYAGQFTDLVETLSRESGRFGFSNDSPDSLVAGSIISADPPKRGDSPTTAFAKISRHSLSSHSTTIDPALLAATRPIDLDTTLAEDLAVSLSLDDALSQSPGKAISSEVWQVLSPPFPISFLSATNSLGSCMHMSQTQRAGGNGWSPTLDSSDGSGVGGLAGAALHPLSLGNVKLLKQKLCADEDTNRIALVGIGGVSDSAGFERMKDAGADAVALATALGAKGVSVFAEILQGAGNAMRGDKTHDEVIPMNE